MSRQTRTYSPTAVRRRYSPGQLRLGWASRAWGFSLLEVVVSLLVMLTVSAGVMSAMVYGAALRARADTFSGAMAWIQEQHAQVQAAASDWTYAALERVGPNLTLKNCPAGDCSLLSNGDFISLKTQPGQAYRLSGLTSKTNGSTLTLTPPLTLPTGSAVGFLPLRLCGATVASQGLGQQFGQSLTALPQETRVFGGRSYALERVTSATNIPPPYNLLEFNYYVRPEADPTASAAHLYTEVIPDAALLCP